MPDHGSLQASLRRWFAALMPSPPLAGQERQEAAAEFDRSRSDGLIQQIAADAVKGSDYNARPWTDLVIVASLANQKSQFGYVFWAPDNWEAALPDGFTSLHLLAELREAMRVRGLEPWAKCRIRITQATGKIDVDFDYEGDKWIPMMSDPAAFAFGLRH